MISRRLVTRICVAGLALSLVYLMVLSIGPLQGRCPEASTDNGVNDSKPKFKAKAGEHFMCLIVPYRNRFEELVEFVPSISNFLEKKNLPHRIFVVNQVSKLLLSLHFLIFRASPALQVVGSQII